MNKKHVVRGSCGRVSVSATKDVDYTGKQKESKAGFRELNSDFGPEVDFVAGNRGRPVQTAMLGECWKQCRWHIISDFGGNGKGIEGFAYQIDLHTF